MALENDFIVHQALTSWTALNDALMLLNEAQLKAMLDTELATQRRSSFLRRIHQRYSILRTKREWLEIEAIIKPSWERENS